MAVHLLGVYAQNEKWHNIFGCSHKGSFTVPGQEAYASARAW